MDIYLAFSEECIIKIKSYFSTKTYVMGTKELSQWDGSFEHPKHKLKLTGKKNIYNFMLKIFVYLNICLLLDWAAL